jgi:hypothetical protein
MSDFLNSLNTTESAPAQSWAQEVATAEAAEPPAAAPEPVEAAEQPVERDAAPEPSQAPETATEETDRRVPLKALQEERQKRAEYERKLDEAMRRMAELEQRVPRAPEPAAEPEPDPETDPIGALKAAHAKLKSIQDATDQQQYETRLNQIAYQAATTFKAQAPDYPDAYRYAINSRAQELAALGTPNESIPQILQREELQLIDTAVRNGRSPAEAIYHFAKARGFTAPAAAPAPAPAPVAAAPIAPAPPNPALQQAKAAVAASASAGGAPASKGELTMTEISNLNGADFDRAWEKLERTAGRGSSMFRK